jgi:tetratricopeptide (TPR) repeat protein
MFESEQGFKDILTGGYIRMATPSLYGLNTTMILPELMTQHWTPTAYTLSGYVSNFDFTQTASKDLLETIWLQYYQTIVNINSLLEEIDEKKDIFANGNYELIKGEAKGLRAFLHFEILRFWGDVPENIEMGSKAIPYVKDVTKNPNQLLSLTYKEVLDNILIDLNDAEELLANDPILLYSNTVLNSPGTLAGVDVNNPHPVDDFHYYRQVKFNYYAVKATKARYYMWIGNKTKAAEYAIEIINAQNSDKTPKFKLGEETEANNGRLTFPTEHIFAVNNSLSTQTLTSVFFNNYTAYTQTANSVSTAYESTIHTSDVRFRNNRLWEVKTILLFGNFNYFKKYNATDKTAVEDIPLIRLAEMYFIVVENGNTDKFRDYRIARGLDSSIDGSLDSPEAIKTRLEREYRKDFYGEGQMFFFYKRLNYNKFSWPTVKEISADKYKLPIPQSQSLFE